ncbi:M12 family metallopeptidase, partial [Granulicoccus phenolivorans]
MSNVRNDRQRSRWRGKVPYEIADTISPIGRQQIADAMAAWTTVAPVSFVARTGESDYIFFHAGDEECFSTSVGHAGGKQRIGCEFPLTPRMVSGSSLAAENQANGGQVDCVFAGADGAIYVMWTVGSGLWSDPVGLTARGTAVPGG